MVKYPIKQHSGIRTLLCQMQTLPLSLLHLSVGKRILIVTLSHGLGIPGLWFFFPILHNAASMIIPVIFLCWLFSYRGLLISIISAAFAVWLIYRYLGGNTLAYQVIVERVILGTALIFLLGLTICWLRAAIDLAQTARQQALTAEQERLLALEGERQVTIAYEQQRKINEMKDQFLLNVSHELRTPLTTLGGCLELLKEYYEHLDPTERAQMLTHALASQQTLVDLVNRVLDTTTVVSELPLARPEAVCVHQLLQEVLAADVESYIISLNIPEQIIVWADPQLLRHVLQNLLSNVFKYVPRQTEIRIEATQAMPSSPVYLSVQDAGPGIPAEELPLLFEKFVRLKRDLAGTTRGMGLGLYICKRLVEAMKGHIWVESSGRPGEGSRFCLTLPPVTHPENLSHSTHYTAILKG